MNDSDLVNIILILIIIVVIIILCIILPKIIKGSKKDKEIEDSINKFKFN